MRRGRRKKAKNNFVRINNQIRYAEVRVLDDDGQNLGTMPSRNALALAQKDGLDLIEVSGKSRPPIVKITDYGKFLYEKKKKDRDIKAKQKTVDTKVIQIKPGTGEGDLTLKAKKISKWLDEGNRVKLDLFLIGRSKYLEKDFLENRLKRVLVLVTTPFRIADGPKKSPKGLTVIMEKASKKDLAKQDLNLKLKK